MKQLNKRIGKSNPQESRLVVQPRGMSRFEPQALRWYFRLIIESEPEQESDKLDLNELRQAGPLALALVGQHLKSEISQVMGKSLAGDVAGRDQDHRSQAGAVLVDSQTLDGSDEASGGRPQLPGIE